MKCLGKSSALDYNWSLITDADCRTAQVTREPSIVLCRSGSIAIQRGDGACVMKLYTHLILLWIFVPKLHIEAVTKQQWALPQTLGEEKGQKSGTLRKRREGKVGQGKGPPSVAKSWKRPWVYSSSSFVFNDL